MTFGRNFLSPLTMVKALDVAPFVEHEFGNERDFERFRRLLYSINGQDKLRFRTRRVYRNNQGPTIQVIRLK